MAVEHEQQVSGIQEQNLRTAKTFLEGIGSQRSPEQIAASFAEDLIFDIQGDEGAMPWIGHKVGRAAMVNFVRDLRTEGEPLSFDVDDLLASSTRAVIIGALRTRIKRTGRITSSQFALVLTIKDGVVTRFQMLEDSYDMSKAAQPLS